MATWQLCWFHVMQWVTRKLSQLLKRHGETLTEAERKELNRLRFLLLAGPEKQAKLSEHQRADLARAWELVRSTVVEEANQLRNDLRAALNTNTSRAEAREQFERLREDWPERFRPWSWRPGEPLPAPSADDEAESATGLRGHLEQIMAQTSPRTTLHIPAALAKNGPRWRPCGNRSQCLMDGLTPP